VNPSSSSSPAVVSHLDSVTGGVFSAPTSGERASRIRVWLDSDPALELLQEVFKELSHRDRGAAKLLKERLDDVRRQKGQALLAQEWAQKARDLLAQERLNLADALAWQRDAARAGAPLSREPLSDLKAALADRVKAIEDLQHRIQVEREAAVLLAQRIEVLSTKSWRDAVQVAQSLDADVEAWMGQADALAADAQWSSIEPRFTSMIDPSRNQLRLVRDAFQAALAQAVAADADPQAPLPAVPVWAEELRASRGEKPADDVRGGAGAEGRPAVNRSPVVDEALQRLEQELAEGHGKSAPKAAAEVRALLKGLGRQVHRDQESRAHALLSQAGELEGWQRWRADQLREELVAKAEGLLAAPEGQRLGGRKMQETLRSLREQWKATDQGGPPNHALWRRFDEACTQAHKVVEEWLAQIRQQSEAHKAQRLSIIEEVRAWTEAHRDDNDWKSQVRALHGFSERWRGAGHLNEKAFADLQSRWKDAMHLAHQRLEAAQSESIERRRALIDEAQALAASDGWRIDAVKDLQRRWQAEAHAVPLDRKQEQKLWDAFRQPIDAAFARKDQARTQEAAALSALDQMVLQASRALDEATASADASRIRAAMAALEAALAGEGAERSAPARADQQKVAASEGTPETSETAGTPATPSPRPTRPLVAVRGDDRPGARRQEPVLRDDRREPRRDGRREGVGRDAARAERPGFPPRGPRLGDAAFRAQRQALEAAAAGLRKLAAQAHGEVLTQLLDAWSARDGEQVPGAQALGSRVAAAGRAAWVAALGPASGSATEALLRLEMAAELPTPAAYLNDRRQLQLQLLTRRNEPGPAQTWVQDVATVLRSAHDGESARRLQAALKVLMRR